MEMTDSCEVGPSLLAPAIIGSSNVSRAFSTYGLGSTLPSIRDTDQSNITLQKQDMEIFNHTVNTENIIKLLF